LYLIILIVITVLETFDLSKNYGPLKAVSGLNLIIEKGIAFGLLGPNGSGKTTTLGMILSVLQPSEGTFKWFGENNAQKNNIRIGSMLETPNFFPYLSLYKNLEILSRIKGINCSEIDRALEETNLIKRKGSRFDTLSLGMKQRMGIAAVLLGKPEVLVLDEPANGLDPEGIAEIRNLIIKQKEQGKTIILASHILDEVEKVCSHVGILKQGKLISSGKVMELLKAEVLIVIKTDMLSELKSALLNAGLVKTAIISGENLEVNPISNVTAAEINRFALERGIPVTEIYVRKNTLEEQFLEVVKG
jgi:ABC-type multidrug transport system ATPase subunit